MKHALVLLIGLIIHTAIDAQAPTWSSHVAPILYAKCTNCHNPGGAGHISLVGYDQAFNMSASIAYQTATHKMPPWSPDRGYSHFTGERYLNDKELKIIQDWVTAGAPVGDTAHAPLPPVYSHSDIITSPDLNLSMPKFQVFNNQDLYQCFVIPAHTLTDKYISKVEVVPGNRNIVHHVLMFQDTSGKARQLDAADPHVGYTHYGDIGVPSALLIGAWVPGSEPLSFPNGMGVKLNKGADIVIQVHYPANSMNLYDSTHLNFRFTSATGIREVQIFPMLHHGTIGPGSMIDGPLVIPAGAVKTFHCMFANTLSSKFTLLGAAPHMHLVGKNFRVFSIHNHDTIPLIKINDWDFNWQGMYNFQRPYIFDIGDTVWAEATYDNTTNNPRNPNHANPKTVTLGEATTDEMMLVYVPVTQYVSGDEHAIYDSTDYHLIDSLANITPTGLSQDLTGIVSTIQFYDPAPNPAHASTLFSYFLPDADRVSLTITDLNGRIVAEPLRQNLQEAGYRYYTYSSSNLAAGEYICTITATSGTRTKKLLVVK
jgi:Copper type II ascorbate-dependent monooxygenase, N-terminal domain/Copper type II ascorbate-dependent monooxygenase, C-terminal domain